MIAYIESHMIEVFSGCYSSSLPVFALPPNPNAPLIMPSTDPVVYQLVVSITSFNGRSGSRKD
jgi:hypothetical protein